ncbi:hypothetical protein K4F52_003948 [Lecanicillium sp. MT-2017a]|nr:hypothetical protein K4F52_003948 [Lecanicillium sp. MT-2017a]
MGSKVDPDAAGVDGDTERPSPPGQQRQTKRTRTRTGCLNCRRKKRKCDEGRPACGSCHRRGQTCEWGLKVTFRAENAQRLEAEHPSMKRMAKRWPHEFEILDVTGEIIRDYNVTSPLWEQYAQRYEKQNQAKSARSASNSQLASPVLTDLSAAHQNDSTENSQAALKKDDTKQKMHQSTQSENAATVAPANQPSVHTDSAVASLLYLSQGGRPFTPETNTQMPVPEIPIDLTPQYMDEPFRPYTPDGGSVDDGIFLPGSTYHELHSTLRNNLFQEVRSNVPSRHGSPIGDSFPPDNDGANNSGMSSRLFPVSEGPEDQTSPLLTNDDECTLWRNWFDEVAPWLDKFDNHRHFQHILPTMAPSHDHLKYSILALSARQIELKYNSATDKSLALYQEAIHLLLPHLPTRSTAVIASCVILCVFEMLSCSPKAWRRHLDGCACLMEAVGINGFVGGVEESLFWTFARMDVCGGLISSIKTLIPVTHWANKGNIEADAKLFMSLSDFDGWANYSVYLMAQVLDLLAPETPNSDQKPARGDHKYRDTWIRLWKHICEWHDKRPASLHPVMTITSSEKSPFPTIIFSNPCAISGNQLYHTASILMLQNQPPGTRLTPKPRSILWHARRVCGISISNDHHGAWTNSLQPLWIAGRCMSNPTEHRAILEILGRIEKESGWGTQWRAEDLKAYWGDLGE